jgi:hypothetical protein
MKLNDDFMRHFRWLTPLLLAFSIFMLGTIYARFEKVEEKVESLRIDMATVTTFLFKKNQR